MIYADFQYYQSTYFGNLISDPDAYDRYATRAAADIDYYTFGRAIDHTDLDAVKMASCAVAEQYLAIESAQTRVSGETAELQSESVGSYHRTYRSSDEVIQAAKVGIRDAIERYLAHTGLMYRGVNGCSHHIL